MHRHSHNHNHSQGSLPRGRPVIPEEGAKASDCFEQFLTASTLKTILGSYRNICEYLHLKPNVFPLFYPKLKAHINSWKAKPLWKKFDLRANQKCYSRGKACPHTRVLIIGAGPCGLRTAIEAQLLGAKVVVVEKRDRMSRNNVLHLWPFVIDDLRALGAKKFFGKFCAGAIDHISIRQLQCILLKVALLLGVEVHTEVSFERIIEPNPNEKTGWRAEFKPFDHPVSQFEFDVIIGADGKRNTLQGFKRKEFRGKLAIAITANFINKRTEAEARVEEISGVAFIFNQKFFKDLYAETGIDLENIVYYKDDTHYFVMTAKKQSLIDKAVIREDLSDTAKLLAPDNVDREELMNYAREAAEFSTNYQMTDLEFAVNHYGQPDVAMFDFTSMYAAENASRVTERHNYKLLSILVGDSLLEPFWPTGSGCARGFLSSMDAAWAIRSWGSDISIPLEVIAERESIYRLLAQTTPENLNKDYKSYTLDPSSRYPNLNKNALLPHQVTNLYDTDDPKSIELIPRPAPTVTEVPKKRRRRESHVDPDTLLNWIKEQIREHDDIEVVNITTSFIDGRILCAIISHYRPDLLDYSAINAHDFSRNNQVAFDILEKELGIPPIMTGEEMANTDSPDFSTMLSYLTKIYDTFRGEIPHIKYPKWDMPEPKRNENVLKVHTAGEYVKAEILSTIQPPRPSSRHKRHVDTGFLSKVNAGLSQDRKARKRKTLEKVGASVDKESRVIPAQMKRETDEDFAARIKDIEEKWREPVPVEKKPKDLLRAIGKIETSDWNIKEIEKKMIENKMGKAVNKDKEKVPKWSREQFLARQTKMERQHLDRQNSAEVKFAEIDKNIKQLEQKLKEGSVRDVGQHKVATITEKLVGKSNEAATAPETKPVEKSNPRAVIPINQGSDFCHFCSKRVYLVERLSAEGKVFHTGCFRCQYCHISLRLGSYMFDREGVYGHRFYCTQHYGMPGEVETIRPEKKLLDLQETSQKKLSSNVIGVDLLDRVQTPERIEFSNLSTGHVSSDHDESPSPIDEDEWTDRNNINSVIDSDSSDDSSSSSDTDTDDETYEEALEEPITKEGTLRWAERYKKRYSHKDDDSDSGGYSSSDHFSYYENSSGDDDSDTATEGEEEIRARELRKQEVRVEPPIDAGTDTEVKPLSNFPFDPHKPSLIPNQNLCKKDMPDILNNTLKMSKSSENTSSNYEFISAESELDELYKTQDQNVPKDQEKPKLNVLSKSITTSSITSTPVKRNFVIPPKERRKSFGKEFVPVIEAEPLLIIKRTPSKINIPPELGKPKVQIKPNVVDTKKYFGEPSKPCVSKPPIDIAKKTQLIKQASLPDRTAGVESKRNASGKNVKSEQNTGGAERKQSLYNFEPEESDMKEIDNYIETLMNNEQQLFKPTSSNDDANENVSSSIEDLLKALEIETSTREDEMVATKPEEKIDDLLSWIEELDHTATETDITSSLKPDKYKDLESVLKKPKQADNVIRRLSKDNISLFENYLLGKDTSLSTFKVEKPNPSNFQLSKSITEVHCNKPRSSIDLDAVKKVDIKKVLQKFEKNETSNVEKPRKDISVPQNIVKRNSFANFSFNRSFEKDENFPTYSKHRNSIGSKDFKLKTEMFENKTKSVPDKRNSKMKDIKRFTFASLDLDSYKPVANERPPNREALETIERKTIPVGNINFDNKIDVSDLSTHNSAIQEKLKPNLNVKPLLNIDVRDKSNLDTHNNSALQETLKLELNVEPLLNIDLRDKSDLHTCNHSALQEKLEPVLNVENLMNIALKDKSDLDTRNHSALQEKLRPELNVKPLLNIGIKDKNDPDTYNHSSLQVNLKPELNVKPFMNIDLRDKSDLDTCNHAALQEKPKPELNVEPSLNIKTESVSVDTNTNFNNNIKNELDELLTSINSIIHYDLNRDNDLDKVKAKEEPSLPTGIHNDLTNIASCSLDQIENIDIKNENDGENECHDGLEAEMPSTVEENYFQALVTVRNIVRNLSSQETNANFDQDIKPDDDTEVSLTKEYDQIENVDHDLKSIINLDLANSKIRENEENLENKENLEVPLDPPVLPTDIQLDVFEKNEDIADNVEAISNLNDTISNSREEIFHMNKTDKLKEIGSVSHTELKGVNLTESSQNDRDIISKQALDCEEMNTSEKISKTRDTPLNQCSTNVRNDIVHCSVNISDNQNSARNDTEIVKSNTLDTFAQIPEIINKNEETISPPIPLRVKREQHNVSMIPKLVKNSSDNKSNVLSLSPGRHSTKPVSSTRAASASPSVSRKIESSSFVPIPPMRKKFVSPTKDDFTKNPLSLDTKDCVDTPSATNSELPKLSKLNERSVSADNIQTQKKKSDTLKNKILPNKEKECVIQ